LTNGDLLVFYAGLQPWSSEAGTYGEAHLYIVGYFVVHRAGLATEFLDDQIHDLFGANAHVRLHGVFADQRHRLVLVKGGDGSRLLTHAVQISDYGCDVAGRPLKIISEEMRSVFGSFGGRLSLQRSSPRWVEEHYFAGAAEYLRLLR
jgi:hypothetical protein